MLSRHQYILAVIIAVIAIATTVYLRPNRLARNSTAPALTVGSVVEARGTIIENTKSDTMNAFLKLKKDDGNNIVRVVYADPTCAYPFKQANTMQAGQKMIVYGQAIAADTISVCPSGTYYIRVVK